MSVVGLRLPLGGPSVKKQGGIWGWLVALCAPCPWRGECGTVQEEDAGKGPSLTMTIQSLASGSLAQLLRGTYHVYPRGFQHSDAARHQQPQLS